MTQFSNALLFSNYFGIAPSLLSSAGLIDPFLNVDTHLFIDPILLDKSSEALIKKDAYQAFRNHFSNVVRLLSISQREGDVAWKAAEKLLSLQEPRSNGLGYGKSARAGASRPEEIRQIILRTAKEIVELGAKDPEMISLMGFFEENIGPDTISDLTTRVIEPQLTAITQAFCDKHKISVKKSRLSPTQALPHYKALNGKERAIILVPIDIVRALPVANDWSDLSAAIEANQVIRARVNALLAGIIQPTVADRKDAVRRAALSSAQLFDAFIAAMKEHATYYDPNIDTFGYYQLKAILSSNPSAYKVDSAYSLQKGIDEIKRVVRDTLEMFAHHVEKGNLWEELWLGAKPKKERAAQLIYYAIADCFCKANNIDISPEANMGGGPIDFKYSKGYQARVLVEMKRSSGMVVHGYEKQLEIYKDASRTSHGFFVIMDYGNMGNKLKIIKKIHDDRLASGEPVSEIVVIDAKKKKSASVRK